LLVVGDEDVEVALEGLAEGNEAEPHTEQAGVDQGPLGLPDPVVEVDGFDRADAAAVAVQQRTASPGIDSFEVGMRAPSSSTDEQPAGDDSLPGTA
jgi:hypothetical protein